jgi:hypothetical protein
MRVRLKGNPLWKWWWPLGGIAVAALIAAAAVMGWPGSLWAAAGVVAVVYVGVPVMAAALGDPPAPLHAAPNLPHGRNCSGELPP